MRIKLLHHISQESESESVNLCFPTNGEISLPQLPKDSSVLKNNTKIMNNKQNN